MITSLYTQNIIFYIILENFILHINTFAHEQTFLKTETKQKTFYIEFPLHDSPRTYFHQKNNPQIYQWKHNSKKQTYTYIW